MSAAGGQAADSAPASLLERSTPGSLQAHPVPGDPAGRPAGLFITGTDTGVGKTIVSAALLAALAAVGRAVHAYKPAITGLKEPSAGWPADDDLLARLCGLSREEVAPLRYGPAVSPHLAAALAGEKPDRARILADARRARQRAGAQEATLVVEGVGGLLVPLTEDLSVRDLAAEMGLPVLIAARPGLGTINHTLLSLEAARVAGLAVQAVVITPWPDEPSALERSNWETIAALGKVEVAGLPYVSDPDRAGLATAGKRLPWRRWLWL